MSNAAETDETVTDFITGREMPNVGSEMNRQEVERFLVNRKGYLKSDIQVDAPVEIAVMGEIYRSRLDLSITLGDRIVMLVKCAAGSLGSREREILAAARVHDAYSIPLAVVSDGRTAVVLDAHTGKTRGEGMDAIPSRDELLNAMGQMDFRPLAEDRREREKIVFRSYDMMTVNRFMNSRRE
jgi:hypothetical protein